jgi:hypothetical protein
MPQRRKFSPSPGFCRQTPTKALWGKLGERRMPLNLLLHERFIEGTSD